MEAQGKNSALRKGARKVGGRDGVKRWGVRPTEGDVDDDGYNDDDNDDDDADADDDDDDDDDDDENGGDDDDEDDDDDDDDEDDDYHDDDDEDEDGDDDGGGGGDGDDYDDDDGDDDDDGGDDDDDDDDNRAARFGNSFWLEAAAMQPWFGTYYKPAEEIQYDRMNGIERSSTPTRREGLDQNRANPKFTVLKFAPSFGVLSCFNLFFSMFSHRVLKIWSQKIKILKLHFWIVFCFTNASISWVWILASKNIQVLAMHCLNQRCFKHDFPQTRHRSNPKQAGT